jgi:4a-hydroxytetrahydrobiopterin dehydratase
MSRRSLLTDAQVQAALGDLQGWSVEGGALCRSVEFADFTEAFAFMTRVALWAEKADHHPDWRNVYRTVDIRLSTHDAGGITAKDVELASKIDAALR